ncbi:MAG: hypothetical protein U1E21_00460 [Reyranellaceae bacterium]
MRPTIVGSTAAPAPASPGPVRTASQRVSMEAASYEIVGRVLLGLPPDRPAHRLSCWRP